MPAAHAENRNMVFPEQRDVVGCYRHEKFNASLDSVIDDLRSPARVLGPHIEAVRRMAATRTRDIFGICRSQIAIDPWAAATLGHRKCGPLGGSAMITISIVWALVFALFTTENEEPSAHENKPRSPKR
jgi:hypothetical protein